MAFSEQGYVEGQNVEILYRWAEQRYDQLPALAADLVARRVAVIFATASAASAMAAKAATGAIPVVFQLGTDPVALGLVASFNRPVGNVTGVNFFAIALLPKRLELLHAIAPGAKSIGFLQNPTTFGFEAQMTEVEVAARALGVRLVTLNARTPEDIDAAFEIIASQRLGALLVGSDSMFFAQGGQLANLALRHAIPAIYHAREIVDLGGLASYGASFADAHRLAGIYTGRILKGEKPADLPVQQSTKVELVINLKTAKALGLTVPETLLATADEVIQ
jgi:putative ABC transport system substrate-binding protein